MKRNIRSLHPHWLPCLSSQTCAKAQYVGHGLEAEAKHPVGSRCGDELKNNYDHLILMYNNNSMRYELNNINHIGYELNNMYHI